MWGKPEKSFLIFEELFSGGMSRHVFFVRNIELTRGDGGEVVRVPRRCTF